jgi:hypothetical protein
MVLEIMLCRSKLSVIDINTQGTQLLIRHFCSPKQKLLVCHGNICIKEFNTFSVAPSVIKENKILRGSIPQQVNFVHSQNFTTISLHN